MTSKNPSIRDAEERLKRYETEVDSEPWKKLHQEAMACVSFEATLRHGINLYDLFIRIDEMLATQETEIVDTKSLFQAWLRPCAKVTAMLSTFESLGFEVENAAEFRKRHAEAIWMLKPSSEAFTSPAITNARDMAVDAMRAKEVEDHGV